MTSGGPLLDKLPEDQRRAFARPWVSPWSLDDEWDDGPAPAVDPPAAKPAEPRPRPKASAAPQVLPAVASPSVGEPVPKPITAAPQPPAPAVTPVTSPVDSSPKPQSKTETAGEMPLPKTKIKTPIEDRKKAPAKEESKTPTVEVRQPQFSWATPILLSLGLLGLTFLAWVYWQDVPRETDEDLRVLQPVDQALSTSAPRRLRSFLDSIHPLRNPALLQQPPWQWPTPALAEHVVGNGNAFDNLRDLLEDYDWHPRHANWYVTDIGSDPAWAEVGVLLQAQAAYLIRRGDEESAFTAAIDLAEFSRRLQEMWSWPSFAARSYDLHTACVQTLAELLKRTRMEGPRLALFQKEFVDCAPSREILEGALSAGYVHEKKLLLGKASGEPVDTMPYGLTQRRAGRLFFKMNETLNLFANAFRELKGEVAARPGAAYGSAGQGARRTRQTAPRFYQPNATGESYFSDRIDPYLNLPERHILAEARHQLVLSLFAVRRHVADRHKLPESLAALKPAYLIEVPVDPFSGEALHFDAVKGRLFSVGVNRVAEGGIVTQPPLNEPREPTVELGIAAAAVVR